MEQNILADQLHESKRVVGSVDISATQKIKECKRKAM